MKSFSILIAALFAVAAKADSRLLQTAAPVAVPVMTVMTPSMATPTTGSSVKSASSSKSSRRKLQTAAPVAVPSAVVTPVMATPTTGSSVKSASSSKSSRRTL